MTESIHDWGVETDRIANLFDERGLAIRSLGRQSIDILDATKLVAGRTACQLVELPHGYEYATVSEREPRDFARFRLQGPAKDGAILLSFRGQPAVEWPIQEHYALIFPNGSGVARHMPAVSRRQSSWFELAPEVLQRELEMHGTIFDDSDLDLWSRRILDPLKEILLLASSSEKRITLTAAIGRLFAWHVRSKDNNAL